MSETTIDMSTELKQLPWREGPQAFIQRVRADIPCEAIVLGIIDVNAPKPDCFLVIEGAQPVAIRQWCESDFKEDPLLKDARSRGTATGETAKNQPGPPLPAGQHTMVHLQPATAMDGRGWYLALARAKQPFTDEQQRLASLLLRSVQVGFDQVEEPDMGRVLLGEDDRLIHADPGTEARFVRHPQTLTNLTEILRPAINQRWPELKNRTIHDLVIQLAGQPVWIRFFRSDQVDDLNVRYWYLELRPLSADDLPPVDLVEDERIARAIAFITDHYAEAPSLSDVARAVSTSPFHFHRLFSREVGLSPKHYLLRMQLQMAKWMLRASRTPIGDIAALTGFASHGHFTATFHRLVGVSPTTYRESS